MLDQAAQLPCYEDACTAPNVGETLGIRFAFARGTGCSREKQRPESNRISVLIRAMDSAGVLETHGVTGRLPKLSISDWSFQLERP